MTAEDVVIWCLGASILIIIGTAVYILNVHDAIKKWWRNR